MSRILEPVKIDMNTEVFFNVKWEDYRGSCIQHQKTEQSDLHPNNGMPKSLVLDNTAIHQKFFDSHDVDYEELGKQTGIDVVSVVVSRVNFTSTFVGISIRAKLNYVFLYR